MEATRAGRYRGRRRCARQLLRFTLICFKAKVAVDAIRGEKTLAELAKLHDMPSKCEEIYPRTSTAVGASSNLLFFSRSERACSSSFVFF